MTNKKEWDSFVRSQGRFRVHDYFTNNKIDCFNMWLDQGKSWDNVVLAVSRLHTTQNESTKGMTSIQGKDLKQTHTPEKYEALIKARKESGMWYPSTDFPDDPDETQLKFNIAFLGSNFPIKR